MKKIIIFLVVITMLTLSCVCAEAGGIFWDFCTKEGYGEWGVNGGEYGIEGGLYRVYSRSTDVQMVNSMTEYDFSASEYPYFAVCYKANTTFTAAAIFFTNESYPAFSGDAVIKFGIRPSGKWETLITDCREAEKIADTWKGTITSVRYDPINMSDDKSDIFISRMGFFPDEKTAQAFLEGAVTKGDYSEETSIIGDMQRVRIPGGVLEDGYNSNDYLCTFTDISDYRKSVVMRKDNDGGKTPVALSDVNSMGYVNMLTDKKGVYTVEENAKAFSDTAHHWAAEYIDYTSAHGLFGGTSETEFSPDMPVTRGMLVTVLGRLLGIDTSLYTKMPYTDVNPDEYYAPYISWTEAEGISDADGMLFRPEEAA
ncbi:MAG: S-layer homology domain-containing protein, partial [Clostridia bacterium]|nr:S-layer homology domain-containing protein [Clostridia bacterium]